MDVGSDKYGAEPRPSPKQSNESASALPGRPRGLAEQDGLQQRPAADVSQNQEVRDRPIGTQAATVMVVDDEPALRTMLGMALSDEGFRVEEVSSGEKAIELLELVQPDVILLDLLMPGLGGLKTCRHIRERSSVPIIMLTGLDRVDDIEISMEAGADDYCTKPVGLDELTARIRARLLGVGRDSPQRADAEFPEIPGDLEVKQARAQSKCVARSELGFLCWRPVAKDLRSRGLDVCRKHAPDPRL